MPDGKGPALGAINGWNRRKRFVKAYLDEEGDPGISMDLNLDFGGISQTLFQDSLTLWAGQMGAFQKEIGW